MHTGWILSPPRMTNWIHFIQPGTTLGTNVFHQSREDATVCVRESWLDGKRALTVGGSLLVGSEILSKIVEKARGNVARRG